MDLHEHGGKQLFPCASVQERHLGSRNWPGKLDLMNVILTGVAEELPGKGPGYELHRLLGTLFPSELTVNEKLGIIETEYHITMEDNIRKDVIGMLSWTGNLGKRRSCR